MTQQRGRPPAPPNNQQRPPQARGTGNQGAPAQRFVRPPIREVGPTADELQPPKRREPGALYNEDLIEAFGAEACTRGVDVEIVHAYGDVFTHDRKSSRHIFLSFVDPRTGKPWEFYDPEAPPAKQRGRKWYVCNQTAKKALSAAFGTRHIVNWVGWVRARVMLVENRLEGKQADGSYVKVLAIRFANVLPQREPTFDYAANVAARIARVTGRNQNAAGGAQEQERQQEPQHDAPAHDDRGGIDDITDEERAAIAAAEREQFTGEPEEGHDHD